MKGKRGNSGKAGISVRLNVRFLRELRMEARRRGLDLSEMAAICIDRGVRSLKEAGETGEQKVKENP